jgi:hypothetical protein
MDRDNVSRNCFFLSALAKLVAADPAARLEALIPKAAEIAQSMLASSQRSHAEPNENE